MREHFFWRLLCIDMQSHLKKVILEEDIGFLDWSSCLNSIRFIGRYRYIQLRTENGRFKLFLWKESKCINLINHKPNPSSCSTSSEAVLIFVWYQATFSIIAFQKCTLNCLIFQIVLALICAIWYLEFWKCLFENVKSYFLHW